MTRLREVTTGAALLVALGLAGCVLSPDSVQLVSKSRDCFGTSVYLDGRKILVVDAEHESVSINPGVHTLEVRKSGFTGAKLRFRVGSWESIEDMEFKLYASPRKRLLKLFMYGQQL